MLNSLDGRALGPYDQTHHSVGHSYLNRYVTRHRRGWPRWRAQKCTQRTLTRRANLREVFRGGKNLALRTGHVLFATSNHEDGFFTSHWCLDVGVGLRSKGLDLAACNQTEKQMLVIISHRCFSLLILEHYFIQLAIHTLSTSKHN